MNAYMKLAIAEAKKGIEAGDGGPFGAVIVKGDTIVGVGHNQVVKRHDPTCHGEIMAIHAACEKLGTFDLSGCVIYTTGEPCPMCLGAILWANISKVYYACSIDDTEIIGFRDKKFYDFMKYKDDKNFIKQIDREEVLKLYNEYNKLNPKKY